MPLTDDERAAKRREAVRGLRVLRAQLEKIRDSGAHGTNTVLTLGERDRYHDDLNLLHDAGEDTSGLWISSGAVLPKSRQDKRSYEGVPWHTLWGAVNTALQRFNPDPTPAP